MGQLSTPTSSCDVELEGTRLTMGTLYCSSGLKLGLLKSCLLKLFVSAGIPVTSIRELRVLQQCKHPNLVGLKRVVSGNKPDR